jgi:flagellar protein FlaG
MQLQSLSTIQSSLGTQLGLEVAGSRQPAQDGASTAAASGQQPKTQVQDSKPATDPAEVKKAVESLNKTIGNLNQSLQFSVDDDTKMDVVKVIDINSREVLRQIPSPEVISIAKAIDKLQGMLIKDKA